MDTVIDERDEEIYTGEELQNMMEEERKKYEGHLKCEFCDEEATFVEKAANGRSPHFRADHKEGCSNMSKTSNSKENEKKEKKVYEKDYDSLSLTFNYYNRESNDMSSEVGKYNSTSKKEKIERHKKKPSKNVKKTISFGRLLTYGLKGILDKQTQEIKINDEVTQINEITFNWENLTASMEGERRLFWGKTFNAGSKNWINTRSYIEDVEEYLSIRLSDEVAEEIWDYLNIEPNDWCEDIPIMVYGKFLFSSNGKPFIPVDNCRYIYISKKLVKQKREKSNK